MEEQALPMEIISDILSRLRVKPLTRFKSVSKSFYALITSPVFIKQHLNKTLSKNNQSRRHLFLSYTSLCSSSLNDFSRHFSFAPLTHIPIKPSAPPAPASLFSDTPPPGIQILGSCHGVICICDWKRDDVFLFNPASKSCRKLKASCGSYSGDHANFGFAYDSSTDDYKVLRMTQCCGLNDEVYNESLVYSLRNDSWKRVDDIPYYTIYRDNHHGVLVNEGLHYIVSETAYKMDRKCIARFDVKTEKFSIVDRPPAYEDALGSWTLYLGELNECLSFTVNYDFQGRAEVWMMREYGKKESWIKLLDVKLKGSGVNVIQIRPITCSSDGTKILTELHNRELCWYNMRERTKERISLSGHPDEEEFNTGVFVETLVSVGNECRDMQVSRKDCVLEQPKRKPKKKSDADNFLTVGFKLKL